MERCGGSKKTGVFLGAIFLILFFIPGLSVAQTLKEVARLNKQVIQMYKQGRYREAIRVVCQNTLSLALRDTDKKIVFKHVHQGNYTDLQN